MLDDPELPQYFVITAISIGFVIVTLYAVNIALIVIQIRDAKDHGKTSRLGIWSWGISIVSLLIPYIAPVSLVMGIADLLKMTSAKMPLRHMRRPGKMAIINSMCALTFLVAFFGLLILMWTG